MYSGYVSMRIAESGPGVTKTAVIRSMRAVKKETLNLIRTFIMQSQDMDRDVILNNFIPALLDPVLGDYNNNVPDARDAEVLLLFAEIINKLGTPMVQAGHIQRIFESVFQWSVARSTITTRRTMAVQSLQRLQPHSSLMFSFSFLFSLFSARVCACVGSSLVLQHS